MSCPLCKKPVIIDPQYLNVSGKVSTDAQSKMNVEASGEAIKMANEMKRADADAGVGKMIPVQSYQKGKGFGKTEMIPLETIKKIDEKIKPILEE